MILTRIYYKKMLCLLFIFFLFLSGCSLGGKGIEYEINKLSKDCYDGERPNPEFIQKLKNTITNYADATCDTEADYEQKLVEIMECPQTDGHWIDDIRRLFPFIIIAYIIIVTIIILPEKLMDIFFLYHIIYGICIPVILFMICFVFYIRKFQLQTKKFMSELLNKCGIKYNTQKKKLEFFKGSKIAEINMERKEERDNRQRKVLLLESNKNKTNKNKKNKKKDKTKKEEKEIKQELIEENSEQASDQDFTNEQ